MCMTKPKLGTFGTCKRPRHTTDYLGVPILALLQVGGVPAGTTEEPEAAAEEQTSLRRTRSRVGAVL